MVTLPHKGKSYPEVQFLPVDKNKAFVIGLKNDIAKPFPHSTQI